MRNARMDEFESSKYEATSSYARGIWVLSEESNTEQGFKSLRGVVQHPLGIIVFCQSKYWPTNHKHSPPSQMMYLTLQINHKGNEHTRRWEAFYGKKTIARLANEFIEEIKGE